MYPDLSTSWACPFVLRIKWATSKSSKKLNLIKFLILLNENWKTTNEKTILKTYLFILKIGVSVNASISTNLVYLVKWPYTLCLFVYFPAIHLMFVDIFDYKRSLRVDYGSTLIFSVFPITTMPKDSSIWICVIFVVNVSWLIHKLNPTSWASYKFSFI